MAPESPPSSPVNWREKQTLGRTGLRVSRLGLGASYPAPAASFEAAFERGVNYFYWGSYRRSPMRDALRHIAAQHRDELVIVLQSYARQGTLMRLSIQRALRQLRMEYSDVLLLGWHNGAPSPAILEASLELKRRGLVRHIALSGHKRTLFPTLLEHEAIDIWHVRYNAVHRGAEGEVFPTLEALPTDRRPGVVTYTTTRWGHLCDPRRVPANERPPQGTDCYRFALSNPHVDLAIAGPADARQMDAALHALELGPMDAEELAWMRRVGDHIYQGDRSSKVRDRV